MRRIGVVLLYLAIDVWVSFITFYMAYRVRFAWPANPLELLQAGPLFADEHFLAHLQVAGLMTLILVILLYHQGLYATERGARFSKEFSKVAGAIFWTLVVGITFSFLAQRFVISRLVLFFYVLLLSPALFTWRFFKRKLVERWVMRGYRREKTLIVGAGRVGRYLQAILARERWRGIDVVGFLDDNDQGSDKRDVLGQLSELPCILERHRIAHVYMTIPSEKAKLQPLITECQARGVGVWVVPELFELLSREVEFSTLGPLPVCRLHRPVLTRGQRILKRLEDLVIASLLLVVFAPVAAAIALAIKLASPGPIIFKQTRLGEGGRPFTLYKFRSMSANTDEAAHKEVALAFIAGQHIQPPQDVYKQVKSRAVTPVGRIIRKFNLDEIPQLWNVLNGDMSLVGPRPPMPYEYERYPEYYKKRLLLKPGITGLWQVGGKYELDFEQMVLLDLHYINEWSLGLDLRILLETVAEVLRGTGA